MSNYIEKCSLHMKNIETVVTNNHVHFRGIPIWVFLRQRVGYKYYNGLKSSQKSNKKLSNNVFICLRNDLMFKKKRDTIIFEANRKTHVNGYLTDPITEQFRTKDTLTVDTEKYLGNFQKAGTPNHAITYLKKIYRLKNKALLKYNIHELNLLKELNDIINKEFGYEITTVQFLKNSILEIYSDFQYYKKSFESINPSEIFFAYGYLNQAPIIAANTLGIRTNEIQYALISNFHIGYGYNKKLDLKKSICSNFLIWSKYWEKEYLNYNNYIVYKNRINLLKKADKKKQVLIISQDAESKTISLFASGIAQNNPEYKVLIRSHPWDMQEKNNVAFSVEGTTEQAINESLVVISLFSTCYYQAVFLGCYSFIINSEFKSVYDDVETTHLIDEYENINEKINKYIRLKNVYF